MLFVPLVFGIWALVAQSGGSTPASDDLSAAKALYASADYQGALARLSAADASRSGDEVDQYRALCLLALGRTAEAQRSIEQLVTRRPFFKMSDTDVSPRLVTMFHDVRKRLLPVAARGLYATAKASFEEQNYPAASAQLKELLVLVADDDLAGDKGALSDLKLLGEGFLKLTEVELAAAAKAGATAPAVTPSDRAAATPAQPAIDRPSVRVYSDADADVTPPVDVVRSFPPWHPPNALANRVVYSGVLRVVIDERGKVESAVLIRPVSSAYDPILLDTAKRWEFRPALRDGEPVKYEKLFSFTLSPR